MADDEHVAHPHVTRLADAMDALGTWLRDNEVTFWADWVVGDARRVRGGDASGLIHFLEAFGGMGSLNDLYFARMNGNATSDAEADRRNREFPAVLDPARSLANALRPDAEPPGPGDIGQR